MLCGPAGLVVFSCGVNDRQLLLAKEVKGTKHWFYLFNKQSIQERYQLAVCYYSVLSGPHVVTSIYQFLLVLPLSAITSGCCLVPPLYVPDVKSIPCIIAELAIYQFSLVVLKGPSFRSQYWQSQGRSIQRWTGEQLTKLPLGSSSSTA